MLTDELRHHVNDAIIGAKIQDHPFPHLSVKSLFPANFYSALMDALPTTAEATAGVIDGETSASGLPHAIGDGVYSLILDAHYVDDLKIADERKRIIQQFVCASAEIRKFLFFKLYLHAREYIEQFASDADVTEHARSGMQDLDYVDFSVPDILTMRSGVYGLPPHIEHPNTLVQSLIYLVPKWDWSARDLGTQLFEVQPPLNRRVRENRPTYISEYPGHETRLVKTLPYRPNSLIAWTANDAAFHGNTMDRDYERRAVVQHIRLQHSFYAPFLAGWAAKP